MSSHFHHMADLDERFATKIDPHMPVTEFSRRAAAHIDQIHELLRAHGASERCHVISATSDLDGKETGLRDALSDVVGSNDGTFISCIPGRLAYFEGEGFHERYLLYRPIAG